MKRLYLLLVAVLAVAAMASAASFSARAGDDPAVSGASAKKKYVVRLKNGGRVETDNYTIDNGKVKINLPSGAISFDRTAVKSIEEVEGGTTVQQTLTGPERKPATPQAPPPAPGPAPAPMAPTEYKERDLNGHTQEWWGKKLQDWRDRLTKATEKYNAAREEWNRYNGLIGNLPGQGFTGASTINPSVSNFQVQQYQDLRGAARVRMDDAKAEMEEAENMLNEILPDEARRAGAPPGWAR